MPVATLPRPLTAAESAPDDRAFDRWLRQELARLHGDVLHEPVPAHLLALVSRAVGAQRHR